MKLAIVGGSAQSTPNLFLYPALRLPHSGVSAVLIGRSLTRLQAVERAVRILTHGIVKLEHSCITVAADARDALSGADVVLVQTRYGGYAARAFSETFPLKYDICGDEGLGPGGLAAAWISWPQFEELFATLRVACPHALIILMSSPLGILTRAVITRFVDLNVLGICELPWTTLQLVCREVHATLRRVTFHYAGVNHLGWFYDVWENDRDLISEFAALRTRSSEFPAGALVKSSAAIPLKYLRLHYCREQVVLEQQSALVARANVLQALQTATMRAFADGGAIEIMGALASRSAPWYEQAVAPFICAATGLECGSKTFFLTVRNEGHVPLLPADDVVEVPHVFRDGKLLRIGDSTSPPPNVLELLEAYVDYERRATDALLARDLQALEEALVHHPWVLDPATASDLSRDIAHFSTRVCNAPA